MPDTTEAPTIRAPRGRDLTCKGWHQEAALRMLMNNLDPDVAERPEDLVVYGGTGRAARVAARQRAIEEPRSRFTSASAWLIANVTSTCSRSRRSAATVASRSRNGQVSPQGRRSGGERVAHHSAERLLSD